MHKLVHSHNSNKGPGRQSQQNISCNSPFNKMEGEDFSLKKF